MSVWICCSVVLCCMCIWQCLSTRPPALTHRSSVRSHQNRRPGGELVCLCCVTFSCMCVCVFEHTARSDVSTSVSLCVCPYLVPNYVFSGLPAAAKPMQRAIPTKPSISQQVITSQPHTHTITHTQHTNSLTQLHTHTSPRLLPQLVFALLHVFGHFRLPFFPFLLLHSRFVCFPLLFRA